MQHIYCTSYEGISNRIKKKKDTQPCFIHVGVTRRHMESGMEMQHLIKQ